MASIRNGLVIAGLFKRVCTYIPQMQNTSVKKQLLLGALQLNGAVYDECINDTSLPSCMYVDWPRPSDHTLEQPVSSPTSKYDLHPEP